MSNGNLVSSILCLIKNLLHELEFAGRIVILLLVNAVLSYHANLCYTDCNQCSSHFESAWFLCLPSRLERLTFGV